MLPSDQKPCLRGHLGERRKNGNCIECERERYTRDQKTRGRMASKSREKWEALKDDPVVMAEHRKYMRQYANKNRDRFNERSRAAYVKNRVRIQLLRKGIEPTEKLVEAINDHHGLCDLCGGSADGRWKTLAIDHCHETNIPRGMLCTKCNKGLGYFQDDPALLLAAIAYLKNPPLAEHDATDIFN